MYLLHQKEGYMYYVLVCVLIASPKAETESLDYDFAGHMCYKTILKLEYMYVLDVIHVARGNIYRHMICTCRCVSIKGY